MTDELERELLRLQARYAVEVVEAFGLCPYAAQARKDGRTAEVIVRGEAPSLDALLEVVDALGRDENVEVAFVILPDAPLDRRALAHRVEEVRHAHQRGPRGLVMTMEGFHPDAPADLTTPGRLVPFLRRTPLPTIQLTRLSTLNRVRRSGPSGTAFIDPSSPDFVAFLTRPTAESVSERIAESNHAKVSEIGPETIERALRDIFQDRDETLARLLGRPGAER